MSAPIPPGRRRLLDVVEDRPLRGGLTGIGLVALATLGMSIAGGILVALALLIAG